MLELLLFVAYGIIAVLATIASVLIINKSKNLINVILVLQQSHMLYTLV